MLDKIKERYVYLCLLLVMMLSIILRIWSTTQRHYINYDEGCYLSDASLILEGKLPYRDFVTKPPLLIYLVSLSMTLLGEGIIQGRLVQASAGILITLLLFLIGRKIYNEKVGLLASFFYAVSFNAIKWSGIIKAETLTMFFATLSVYLFIVAVKDGSRIHYTLSGSAAALASLTKFSNLIIVAYVLFFIIKLARDRRLKNMAVELGLLLSGFLLTGVIVMSYFVVKSSFTQVYYTLFEQNLDYYLKFFGHMSNVLLYVRVFIEQEFLYVAGAVAFLIVFTYNVLSRKGNEFGSSLMLLWLLSFMIEMAVVGMVKLHIAYLIQALPVLSLLTAKAMHTLGNSLDKYNVLGSLVFLISLAGVGIEYHLHLLTIPLSFLILFYGRIGLTKSGGIYELSISFPPREKIIRGGSKNLTVIFVFSMVFLAMTANIQQVSVRGEDVVFRVSAYLKENTRAQEEVFTVSPMYVFLAERKLPLGISHPMILVHQLGQPPEERERMNVPSDEEIVAYLKNSRLKFVVMDFYMSIVWPHLPPEARSYIESEFVEDKRFGDARILARPWAVVTSILTGPLEIDAAQIDGCESTENWQASQTQGEHRSNVIATSSPTPKEGSMCLDFSTNGIYRLNEAYLTYNSEGSWNWSDRTLLGMWIYGAQSPRTPFGWGLRLRIYVYDAEGNCSYWELNDRTKSIIGSNWTRLWLKLDSPDGSGGDLDTSMIDKLVFEVSEVGNGIPERQYLHWYIDDISIS